MTRDAEPGDDAWEAFRERYASWRLWGSVAPLAAVLVMVLKPPLPGL